jgi:glycosyltransferase involved in cell wall biosynthesis
MGLRVFIITPTLGTSQYLDRTLAGVRRLGCEVDHLLVCPAAKVQELATRYPGLRVVEDQGKAGGIYGALNAGLKNAPERYDWFTYINDDDELGPDFGAVVEKHSRRAEPEPVVYGDVRRIGEANESLGFITVEKRPRYLPALLHAGISPLNQQGMLFAREVVERLREFDLRYRLCADLDFWVRAFAAGFSFRYVSRELGQFRIRQGQLSGDISLTRAEMKEIATRHLATRGASRWARAAARVQYRLSNLPRYAGRVRHTGLQTAEATLAGRPA